MDFKPANKKQSFANCQLPIANWLFLCALLILSCFTVDARNLSAFFSVCTFNSPDKGPYIETYLNIVGNSVKLVTDESGKYRGKVEVEISFTRHSEPMYHDKYNLLGAEVGDTNALRPDFIDQQRILLPNGDYDLELKIRDKYAAGQTFTVHRAVKLNYPDSVPVISDIELVASYTATGEENQFNKSGYHVVPLVSDYYPQALKEIKFYAEIYNTKKALHDDPFIINYMISGHESRYIVRNLAGFKRETPKDVCVVLAELPIKDLPSGNYDLTIEVRNKSNALLATKQVFFERSNVSPEVQAAKDIRALDVSSSFVSYITNKDSMKDYIESVRPISSRLETDFADNQLDIADLKYMQQFFYDFWVRRNGGNPEKAWNEYNLEVKKVNAAYSTGHMRGYATDRGRIYLKYGPPNSIFREDNEPYAYPYEIWHYFKLADQTNRKFLFWCHEPATNFFELLHSDAQGERYNDRWQTDLYSRILTQGIEPDNISPSHNPPPSSNDYFGRKAVEEFYSPK